MKTILLDTGYWIALFSPEKEKEKQDVVEQVSKLIDGNNYTVIIPFPTLYEFLNSKLSRKGRQKFNLEAELSKQKYEKIYDEKIYDEKYRKKALENFFKQFSFVNYDISLVDEIIKEMIGDTTLKTDIIVTFDNSLKNYASSMNVEVFEIIK
jgi:predicted nucleic acid-binding protein